MSSPVDPRAARAWVRDNSTPCPKCGGPIVATLVWPKSGAEARIRAIFEELAAVGVRIQLDDPERAEADMVSGRSLAPIADPER